MCEKKCFHFNCIEALISIIHSCNRTWAGMQSSCLRLICNILYLCVFAGFKGYSEQKSAWTLKYPLYLPLRYYLRMSFNETYYARTNFSHGPTPRSQLAPSKLVMSLYMDNFRRGLQSFFVTGPKMYQL